MEWWSDGGLEGCGVGVLRSWSSRSLSLVHGVVMINVNQAELFQLGTHVVNIESELPGGEAGANFGFAFFPLFRRLQHRFQFRSRDRNDTIVISQYRVTRLDNGSGANHRNINRAQGCFDSSLGRDRF